MPPEGRHCDQSTATRRAYHIRVDSPVNPPIDSTCLASSVWKSLYECRQSISDVAQESKELWIISDYGGSHRNSRVETYSFLLCDVKNSGEFRDRLAEFRQGSGRALGEIAFSKIRNEKGREALRGFLGCALALRGQIITVAIDKVPALKQLYLERARPEERDHPIILAANQFKSSVLPRVWRIVHLVAALVAAFTQPDWRAVWVTDEDDITASGSHGKALTYLLAAAMPHYMRANPASGEVHTTRSLREFPVIGELASIPDLCAGAVAEMLSLEVKAECRMEHEITQHLAAPTPRTSQLLTALLMGNANLRHIALRVAPDCDGSFLVGLVRFGN